MLRFISITLILVWLMLLAGGVYLYLSALVLYCTGKYVGFAICIVSSIIYILQFIEGANQLPDYFYQILHNHSKYEDDRVIPIMIYKDKKEDGK